MILDSIRGEIKSQDIIVAHIKAVIELILKTKRKDIKIFFPDNAPHGNPITKEFIIKKLNIDYKGKFKINEIVGFNIEIQEQDYYDPHYEWNKISDNARDKGNIPTRGGLEIVLK